MTSARKLSLGIIVICVVVFGLSVMQGKWCWMR